MIRLAHRHAGAVVVMAGSLAACAPAVATGSLQSGDSVVCVDPSTRESLGPLERADLGPDWSAHTPAGWEGDYLPGESLAIEDFDGDGGLDVLVGDKSALIYYASEGDGWREVSRTHVQSDDAVAGISVVSPADIDGDGDLDLLVGRSWALDMVLENQGDGTFVDTSEGRGLPSDVLRVRGAPFGDMDADGDLDLFLAHDRFDNLPPEPGLPNYLYENQGDGTFVDVSERLTSEDRDGYTKVGAWFDADEDGAQDLYVINHLPEYQGNRLRFNLGDGTFESDPSAGADLSMSGMGFSIADLNGDLLPDMAISGLNEVVLLQSVGERSWANVSLAMGVVTDASRVFAWGNTFGDFDNDGRVDVFATFGEAEEGDANGPNPPDQPDALWLQEEDGAFRQVAEEWGVDDPGVGRAAAAVDIDGDGWLDLFTHGHNEPAVFYRARCGDAGWLEVRVRGAGPNTHAIGARVSVEVDGRVQARWIEAGGALYTSGPAMAHFGLGTFDAVDRLEVRWPDGTVDVFEDVPARQRVTVTQVGG